MDHRRYQSNIFVISSRSDWQPGSSNFRTIAKNITKRYFQPEGYNISFRRPMREFIELAENEKYRRYERPMVS